MRGNLLPIQALKRSDSLIVVPDTGRIGNDVPITYKGLVSRYLCLEDNLLLCCICTFLDRNNSERLKELLVKEADLSRLIKRAKGHRVLPLLYWSINSTCSGVLPADIESQLHVEFQKNAIYNLACARELLRVLDIFETHGIPAIPFKGPTLASEVYGDLSSRQFGDLDILVHLEDVPRVEELLHYEGYRLEPEYRLTQKQKTAFLRSTYHHHFHNPDSGIIVEVHWRISSSRFSSQVDVDGLWDRAKPVTLCGKKVLSLSTQDMLLVFCEHGARHTWERLSWICDVAMLIKAKDINWPHIFKQAQEAGSEQALLLGLFLANNLLDAALPPEISQKIQNNCNIVPLSIQVIERLFAEEDPLLGTYETSIQQEMNQFFFYRKSTDQFMDRARCYLRIVFTPSARDFNFVSLPDALFSLYCLLRPIRLMYDYRLSLLKWMIRKN